MNDLKVKIDINQIFTEFFKLNDWKARSLGIGGLYILIAILSLGGYGFVILLGLGGVLLAFLLMILMGLFLIIVFFTIKFYLAGYRLDLIKVMQQNGEVENVSHLTDFGRRVTEGFKLNISLWAYILIPTLVTFVGSLINSLSAQLMDTSGSSFGEGYWVFLIIGYSISGIGALLQFLTRFFFNPLLTARFVKNDSRIADTINMTEVLTALRSNFKELLVVGGLIFLAQTIVMFAIYMSAFFILLCIGLFLFPVAVSVGTVYMQHLEARLVTSILNSSIVNPQ